MNIASHSFLLLKSLENMVKKTTDSFLFSDNLTP